MEDHILTFYVTENCALVETDVKVCVDLYVCMGR